MKYNYDEILNRTDLGKIILENTTISGIMRDLNLPTRGRLYSVFKKKILNAGYDLSHITGIPKYKHNEKTLDEHFSKNSTTKSNKIKTLLFKYGLKEKVCECCGITDWNGKPLVLQLHHIDGNPTNNTIENLQILCPNCHSQTDTYCNKKRNENKIVKKYVCERCGEKRIQNIRNIVKHVVLI